MVPRQSPPAPVQQVAHVNQFTVLNESNEVIEGILSWNLRGLNMPLKQREVIRYTISNKVALAGLLETRIKIRKAKKIQQAFGSDYSFVDNYSSAINGRIWVLWDNKEVSFQVISSTDQTVHGEVQNKAGTIAFLVTFVYAYNTREERSPLWAELRRIASSTTGIWLILGDFNSVLEAGDRIGGNAVTASECDDFINTVADCQLQELRYTGWSHTWRNKQDDRLIYSKIDRCFGNVQWFAQFDNVVAHVPNPGCSDHSPLLLNCGMNRRQLQKRFRVLNVTADHPSFDEIIRQSWSTDIEGTKMYRVWMKLKKVRENLRGLTRYFSFAEHQVISLRNEVEVKQSALMLDPLNQSLFQDVKFVQSEYEKWSKVEENILKQKSKVHWLNCGDGNNKFFHASLKARGRSGILVLFDDLGNKLVEDVDIKREIMSFYQKLLGTPANTSLAVDIQAVQAGNILTHHHRLALVAPITADEIYKALMSIGDASAPGADGFTAKFYKCSWHIIGSDIIDAIQDFFLNGRLLKSLNTSLITLIPKSQTTNSIRDYRPIACCNVLYKIISKVITNRLGKVMQYLTGDEQAAFVPGRYIHDNTILAQEIIKGYGRQHISARCMVKMDLQKAYDSIQWNFVEHLLRTLGFPAIFVQWIIVCLNTVSYQINVNGQLTEPFKGGKGDLKSVHAILDCFERFSKTTGLIANRRKSEIYFAGVRQEVKESILSYSQIPEGNLPLRYLGVPLNGKRLLIIQYQPLLEKMVGKIQHWTSRLLSYGGRIQLIQSVLFAVQQYWSQIFIFPKKVMSAIESICRRFLWTGTADESRRAPVAWDSLCRPKAEGGLSLSHPPSNNKVTFLRLLWALHHKKDKLWIRWIHAYYIKTVPLKNVLVHPQASFLLRKILKCRDQVVNSGNWDKLMNASSFDPKAAYDMVRPPLEKVTWKELMLNNRATPKARFCLWMALRGRLATKDRMIRFDSSIDPICSFCSQEPEDLNHLLFCCVEIRNMWSSLLSWYGLHCTAGTWEEVVIFACQNAKGKRPRNRIFKTVFTEFVYAVWMERNRRIFQNSQRTQIFLIREVFFRAIGRCIGDKKMEFTCKSLINFRSS
ncbi:hypothetical protein OROGR_025204 [Orobanche gracilis]